MHPRPRSPLILPIAVVVTLLYVGLVRLILLPGLGGPSAATGSFLPGLWNQKVLFGLALPQLLQVVNALLIVFLGIEAQGLKRGLAALAYGAMVLVAYLAYAIWSISRSL